MSAVRPYNAFIRIHAGNDTDLWHLRIDSIIKWVTSLENYEKETYSLKLLGPQFNSLEVNIF